MESNPLYRFLPIPSELHVRQRVQEFPGQMDFSYMGHMGHQMHGQQDLQYSEGPGDLEDELYRVQPLPFQANLSGSMSSWTQHHEALPSQVADPSGYNHNRDLEDGHHQVESPPFQANLSGSMSSWTQHLPSQVADPAGYHHNRDLEDGHHQVEPPPFQANLFGSMSSWTQHLPSQIADQLEQLEPEYDDMGSGPIYQPQRMNLAGYMKETCSQLRMWCKQRGIQTSRTTKKSEYVNLAQPLLPGVDCWALRNSELREKCKAHNVAIPNITQNDSKAVMAQKLVEDDARWGL